MVLEICYLESYQTNQLLVSLRDLVISLRSWGKCGNLKGNKTTRQTLI